jgi:glyceraldehyde 3-phosphate dehydrogenase
MVTVKLGINGFGRIGKLILREAIKRDNVEVVAINDIMDVTHIAHALAFDSVHGHFNGKVEIIDGALVVNGKKIRVTSEKDPTKIAWNQVEVDVVAECTRRNNNANAAKAHIMGGAKKVVIASTSADVPMFVVGVNHNKLTFNDLIISGSSGTANCLAPIIKVLHDKYTVLEASATAIQGSSSSQPIADIQSKRYYRRGRSGLLNIIPSFTGAAVAVGEMIPALKDRLTATSIRVPVGNVSLLDLTVRLESNTSYSEIMEAFDAASKDSLKGVLGITKNQLVSQDFISDTRSCVVDFYAGTQVNSRFHRIIAWYDNEYAYSCRVIDLALYIKGLVAPPE